MHQKVKMYDVIHREEDFVIRIPLSGGKAGKGHAKTSNVQVINFNDVFKKFPFIVNDYMSRLSAISKAKEYLKQHFTIKRIQ